MRKISIITGLFLAIVLAAGCGTVAITPAQTPVQPTAQAPAPNATQTVSGLIQAVSLSNIPGTAIVSIKTETGTQNISVSNNTSVAIAGQACTLDEINLFNIQGQSYNCTAVYNACDGQAYQFNVVKIFN
jgi:hypothetical protein